MFDGFANHRIDTGGCEIHALAGGSGPPLLLLHGYPQTHVMWHKVAPSLAERFTVIAPDLRGYGASAKPAAGNRYEGYSKRTMASDMVRLMQSFGHERFALAGHDRGGRVSYRLALDHPARVSRLVTLDIIPTLDTFEQAAGPAARGLWHWYFLAKPPPLPERLIAAERRLFLDQVLTDWAGAREAITDDAFAAYLAAWTDDTIRATCDDYRAGARVDCAHDAADREAGRTISCPLLALWGGENRDLVPAWKRWATDVHGVGLDCGHFMAEEAPDEVVAAMLAFLERA